MNITMSLLHPPHKSWLTNSLQNLYFQLSQWHDTIINEQTQNDKNHLLISSMTCDPKMYMHDPLSFCPIWCSTSVKCNLQMLWHCPTWYSKTCLSWPPMVPEKVVNIRKWSTYTDVSQNNFRPYSYFISFLIYSQSSISAVLNFYSI
jgi:hypothetical protein